MEFPWPKARFAGMFKLRKSAMVDFVFFTFVGMRLAAKLVSTGTATLETTVGYLTNMTEDGTMDRLLDYELRASQRYRRFVAVVRIACEKGRSNLMAFLGDAVRSSDEIVQCEDGTTILMGETNGAGALAAIKRYKECCNGSIDMRFGVASYPTDGCDPNTLLSVAGDRLEKARHGSWGSVVWQGCN